MDFRPQLTRHDVPLSHQKEQWNDVAKATGLTPYAGKASYICGVMRELMETAGLCFNTDHNYQLGAIFAALNATELLGWTVTGGRRNGAKEISPTDALRSGLDHLASHQDPQVGSLPLSVEEYVHLRNFTGHGVTSLPRTLRFDPDSTRLLLLHLAHSLNTMWDIADLSAGVASVQVDPLWTEVKGVRQPVYVNEIQTHLAAHRPADDLKHQGSWRYVVVQVSAESPPASGW